MEQISKQFTARVFTDWITDAEYAQLSVADQWSYDRYWMARNDRQNQDASAKRRATEEGRAEGLQEGRREGLQEGLKEGIEEGEIRQRAKTINKLASRGMSEEQIADILEITVTEIKAALPR